MASGVGSLTERQVECLRLVGEGYRDKEIALELGIHHETVRKHVKTGMSRLDTNSRFVAARRLAKQSGHGPERVHPPRAMGREPSGPPITSTTARRGDNDLADAVEGEGREGALMEERATFARLPDLRSDDFAARGNAHPGMSPFTRLAAIALLTLLIAMAAVSAVPMSNAVQQLANALDPP